MKNKLWKRPDGTVSMTSIDHPGDLNGNEDVLLQLDNVPSDWELIANDYEGGFPSIGSSDSWIWDGARVIVDPEKENLIHNTGVDFEIRALEGGDPLSRAIREFMISSFAATAASRGVDPTTSPAYVKVKALDDQIAALRRQRK